MTMSADNKSKLVIAISSTALFDMAESHNIYEQQGVVARTLIINVSMRTKYCHREKHFLWRKSYYG